MTIPVWVLLAFAGWTVALLALTVGTYRWSRILSGRVEISEFRADRVEGSDFYRRAMRAHQNCVENLPVYGAVVVAIVVSGLDDVALDALAIAFLAARVVHSCVHVFPAQTNLIASVRFGFFAVQLVCVVGMGAHAAMAAAG